MACWWAWSEEVERQCIHLFRPFLRHGDLAFDIGANRGRKTWVMRQLGARVVAVEPLLHFGQEFVPEFGWKWGADLQVKAVGRAVTTARTVEIAVNRFMPFVSSTDTKWMTQSAHAPKYNQPYYRKGSLIRRQVPGITLDGLINIYGSPKFIKVDVEGAENSVMATLSTPVPAFNMEFHRDWIPVPAIEHMERLGQYQWRYAVGNEGRFAMRWASSGQLLTALSRDLTQEGHGSWGDIYGRLVG